VVTITSEYLLWTALEVVLLFVAGHVLLQESASAVPRIDFEVIKSMVVRKSSGIHFEFEVSNLPVCVDLYIAFTLKGY